MFKEVPVNISVILAHPSAGSFNHAIADAAGAALLTKGHRVLFHDLYAEGFDPVLPAFEVPKNAALGHVVERHCAELVSADGIIIVHPNWWGQPPAVMKGWIDRVIRPGVAYEFVEGDSGEGVPRGLLKAGAAIVFNTSNTAADREAAIFGDPLDTIWKNCIFGLCGVTNFHRRTFGVVATSTPQRRAEWLKEVRETVERYFG